MAPTYLYIGIDMCISSLRNVYYTRTKANRLALFFRDVRNILKITLFHHFSGITTKNHSNMVSDIHRRNEKR